MKLGIISETRQCIPPYNIDTSVELFNQAHLEQMLNRFQNLVSQLLVQIETNSPELAKTREGIRELSINLLEILSLYFFRKRIPFVSSYEEPSIEADTDPQLPELEVDSGAQKIHILVLLTTIIFYWDNANQLFEILENNYNTKAHKETLITLFPFLLSMFNLNEIIQVIDPSNKTYGFGLIELLLEIGIRCPTYDNFESIFKNQSLGIRTVNDIIKPLSYTKGDLIHNIIMNFITTFEMFSSLLKEIVSYKKVVESKNGIRKRLTEFLREYDQFKINTSGKHISILIEALKRHILEKIRSRHPTI